MEKDPLGEPDPTPDLMLMPMRMHASHGGSSPDAHLDLSREEPSSSAFVTVRHENSSTGLQLRVWRLQVNFSYHAEGPHSAAAALLVAIAGLLAAAILIAGAGVFLYWLYLQH
jgi:hypothetical protein